MGNAHFFTIGFSITLMILGILLYGRVKFGQFLHKQNPRKDLIENRLKMEKRESFQGLICNLKILFNTHSFRSGFKKPNLEKQTAPL